MNNVRDNNNRTLIFSDVIFFVPTKSLLSNRKKNEKRKDKKCRHPT